MSAPRPERVGCPFCGKWRGTPCAACHGVNQWPADERVVRLAVATKDQDPSESHRTGLGGNRPADFTNTSADGQARPVAVTESRA